MKRLLILITLLSLTRPVFAGQESGGGPKAIVFEFSSNLMSKTLADLPKVYAEQDEFRLASARLSVSGTETTNIIVNSELIKVRKLHNSIVDENISQEILPQ